MKKVGVLVGCVVGLSLVAGAPVMADTYSSSNFQINGVLGNSFGGSTSSSTYQLTSSGGESIIGNGSGSASYKLGGGYVSQLERSLSVSVASGTVSFGTVIPGTSVTKANTITVATDDSSYALSIQQSSNLTSGTHVIPAVSGTITSPVTWQEGTTKGFGFSLASVPGTLDSKWDGGDAYAALPTAPTNTQFFARSGIGGYTTDMIGFQYRLDADKSQPTGAYQNTVTITAAGQL